jgi:signal transduction histidine kinase
VARTQAPLTSRSSSAKSDLLRPEARVARVTTGRQRCGDPIPPARMDGEKMKQVVMNLLRNAVEAMPEGGACD